MHFKYKKKVTKGANGTTIRHNTTEENPILVLGDIDGYTFIFSESPLDGQNEALNFTQVVLTIDEINELNSQRFMLNIDSDVLVSIKYANVSAIIQKMLDDEAKSLGFDDINSIAKFLVREGKYKVDAESLADWTTAVWTKSDEIQKDIADGAIEEPTLEEFMAMLPVRV